MPDAGQLARTVTSARADGRRIRSVVVTLPDNPTGLLAPAAAVRALGAVAREHDLIIISDEIYRDLVHDPDAPFTSPAALCPERTVITTGLSKNLALGGWRLGVARLPGGGIGPELRARLLGIGSEIWSAPAGPVQQAAALAFTEPPALAERVGAQPAPARHRRPRGGAAVRRGRRGRARAAGGVLPVARTSRRSPTCCSRRHGITSDEGLAAVLLRDYGIGALPGQRVRRGAARRLRLRVATSAAVRRDRPGAAGRADTRPTRCSLPWIAASLARLERGPAGPGPTVS